ncbi:chemotaxis protein W [Spirochaetia bacterium]|nr:chemotaxis protein W [Spirochaetia bacterium]
MATIKDLAAVNAALQQQKDRVDNVDFKMVTFSLAGKDYGVDIMNVKEIAKAEKFTYVPNAASYVRGVYNLRGDIIPIIDLRSFFHLPQEKKKDGIENMLILRIEERVYGTIVDRIDKVVGINTSTVQPPHPIFGDINIKYISGVVEKLGDLYIILDVVRIFSTQKEEDKPKSITVTQESGETVYANPVTDPAIRDEKPALNESTFGFIKESLLALRHFTPCNINDGWLRKRFTAWCSTRSESEQQLRDSKDADEFLSAFYSPNTGTFWNNDYALQVMNVLPDLPSNAIQAWNLGCGKGYETYSFVCILKERYPNGHIKIWANDNDIMAIAQAPNMLFNEDEIPKFCQPYMSKGKNGLSFSQEIKDAIVFEYHDITNENILPEVDFILARDILSFITVAEQEKLIATFMEKLKKRGTVILGANEQLTESTWQPIGSELVSAFMHA